MGDQNPSKNQVNNLLAIQQNQSTSIFSSVRQQVNNDANTTWSADNSSVLISSILGENDVTLNNSKATTENLTSNPTATQSRRTSEVWRYFRKLVNTEGQSYASCILCSYVTFSYKIGTTNMWYHLREKHFNSGINVNPRKRQRANQDTENNDYIGDYPLEVLITQGSNSEDTSNISTIPDSNNAYITSVSQMRPTSLNPSFPEIPLTSFMPLMSSMPSSTSWVPILSNTSSSPMPPRISILSESPGESMLARALLLSRPPESPITSTPHEEFMPLIAPMAYSMSSIPPGSFILPGTQITSIQPRTYIPLMRPRIYIPPMPPRTLIPSMPPGALMPPRIQNPPGVSKPSGTSMSSMQSRVSVSSILPGDSMTSMPLGSSMLPEPSISSMPSGAIMPPIVSSSRVVIPEGVMQSTNALMLPTMSTSLMLPGTTSLSKIRPLDCFSPKQSISVKTEIDLTHPITEISHDIITNCLIKFVTLDLLPLSVIEGEGFLQLLAEIIPTYNVPSILTIQKIVFDWFEEEKKRVGIELNKFDYVAISTECWTNRTSASYITVMTHAIDDNWNIVKYVLTNENFDKHNMIISLKDKLISVMETWNIAEKTVCIVHDDVIEVSTTSSFFPKTLIRECFTNSIQSCINKGLEGNSIQKVTKIASLIVGYFKHSTNAFRELEKALISLNIVGIELVQPGDNKWDSVYTMIARLIEAKPGIRSVLNNRNITSMTTAMSLELSEFDWELLGQLAIVLKPFDLANKVLFSTHSPTVSMLKPLLDNMINNVSGYCDTEHPQITKMKKEIKSELITRFKTVNTPSILDKCCFLDPRYKHYVQNDDGIIHSIKTWAEESIFTPEILNVSTNDSEENVSTDLDMIFLNTNNTSIGKSSEINRYILENSISIHSCPLMWWKANATQYAQLSKLAKKYLCIPAILKPPQKSFSTAQNNMPKETINNMMFLANNLNK